MSIFRLLPLSLLIAAVAVSAVSQSSPEINPVVPPTDFGRLNSSGSVDLLSPNLKTRLNPPNPMDRIHIEDYAPQLNKSGLPRILTLAEGQLEEGQSQEDTVCYAIRNYLVVPDSPHSDATHVGGYSTCQPATRFRVYNIKGPSLPPTP